MSSRNNKIKPLKSNLIFDAILFASKAHVGQYRKATRIPYIIHPLGVGRILIEHNMSDAVVAAGILHDTLEDTSATASQLRKKFGQKVTRLVEGASEPDKSDTWKNRKIHTIESLKKAPTDLLCVACADKLDNVRSMVQDYKKIGVEVFDRFSEPKSEQKWYYTSLSKVFMSRAKGGPVSRLFREYEKEVRKLFG
jgi:(p)ppGpp synthase/HD superfamily hydrolase